MENAFLDRDRQDSRDSNPESQGCEQLAAQAAAVPDTAQVAGQTGQIRPGVPLSRDLKFGWDSEVSGQNPLPDAAAVQAVPLAPVVPHENVVPAVDAQRLARVVKNLADEIRALFAALASADPTGFDDTAKQLAILAGRIRVIAPDFDWSQVWTWYPQPHKALEALTTRLAETDKRVQEARDGLSSQQANDRLRFVRKALADQAVRERAELGALLRNAGLIPTDKGIAPVDKSCDVIDSAVASELSPPRHQESHAPLTLQEGFG